MIKLYDYELSVNCYKQRLLMSILGVPYEAIPVDFYPGWEHKSAAFKKINPLGHIPVIDDNGFVLRDAHAILVYLAAKYDPSRRWYPMDEAPLLGETASWMLFAEGTTNTASAARLYVNLGYDFDIEACRAGAHRLFRALDAHLWMREQEGRAWVCSAEHPTIADLALFPDVMLSEEGGISRLAYPALRRWTERFKRIPGFRTMPGIFPAGPAEALVPIRPAAVRSRPMPSIEIPPTPDAVTAGWLTEVLRHSGSIGPGTRVASFVGEAVGAGVGVMGVLLRATLTYDGALAPGAPDSVIVKLPSPYAENRAQGVGLGMYEAEVRFLNELAAHTPVRVPKVHLAEIVSGTADFAIVMEDLGHLEIGDQIVGLPVARATAAALALADVHAAWWGKVQTPELEWIPSVVHPRIQGLAAMWPDLWVGFNAKFGHVLPPGAFEVGEQVKVRYWGLMEAMAAMPWTLIHQDFRVDNLFFDDLEGDDLAAGDPVVIIDWQGLGRGPAVYDLAYFLGGSLTVDDRRGAERDIVAAYHRRLVDRGVAGYGFEELWTGYRMGMLSGLSTAVLVGATFDLANARGRALVEVLGSRHFAAAVDLDALDLLPEAPSGS